MCLGLVEIPGSGGEVGARSVGIVVDDVEGIVFEIEVEKREEDEVGEVDIMKGSGISRKSFMSNVV